LISINLPNKLKSNLEEEKSKLQRFKQEFLKYYSVTTDWVGLRFGYS